MHPFLTSTGVVALAEIGDKTQLLALMLAARYRRPAPIILGIFLATVFNHAGAAALGHWLTQLVPPHWMRWLLGGSFIAMAAWLLVPDKVDEEEAQTRGHFGVLMTTIVVFFMAEMGDKTQIATVALAARYHDMLAVVMGTTVGMMLANVPAVLMGEAAAHRLPTRWVHAVAALVFAVIGVAVLGGLSFGF